MPLKNRQKIPPNGFMFRDKLGVIANTGATFDDAVIAIRKRRVNNKGHGMPMDVPSIESELDEFTCARLKYNPAWCLPTGEEYKKKPLPTPEPVTQRVVRRVASVAKGSVAIADWLGKGGSPVSQETADLRAAICADCIQNDEGPVLERMVASRVQKFIGLKNDMQLKTPSDDKLKTCGVCDCVLKLKVWMPIAMVLSHTSEEELASFPSNCWIPAEKKRLAIVLPFSTNDSGLAIHLLEWMRDLGGLGSRPLVLFADRRVSLRVQDAIHQIALDISSDVYLAKTPYSLPNEGWPIGANHSFYQAALFVNREIKLPWLWLEPDCTPIRRGWIEEIEEEYYSNENPFLGPIVKADPPHPPMHLTGCSVYPPNCISYIGSSFAVEGKAFDIQLGPEWSYESTNSKTIQHFWGVKDLPPTFIPDGAPKSANAFYTSQLRKETALFHRCKDGSLIRLLREKRKCYVSESKTVTVMVTSYKRARHLSACITSLKQAGVKNVLISAADPDSFTKRIISQSGYPSIVQHPDPGNNISWIKGVQACKTSHVHILHDDDKVTQHWPKVVDLLNKGANFIHFDGEKHGIVETEGLYEEFPEFDSGYYPAIGLLSRLMNRSFKTFSPVGGVFPVEFASNALMEFQDNCNSKEFSYHKPTMLVGNDLLLWLLASIHFKQVWIERSPMVSYGHHLGSVSFRDAVYREGILLPIYNRTRDYFLRERLPISIHAIQAYNYREEDRPRIMRAYSTWKECHKSLGFKFLECHTDHAERTSKNIGDHRDTLFLRDLLSNAIDYAIENGATCVMISNDDTYLHGFAPWVALGMMTNVEAACSFRTCIKSPVNPYGDPVKMSGHGQKECGRDLFIFKVDWLQNNLNAIPDYVLGATDWDSTLSALIRLTHSFGLTKETWLNACTPTDMPWGYVYHEDHEAQWATARHQWAANRWNRKQTKEFMKTHGINFDLFVQ